MSAAAAPAALRLLQLEAEIRRLEDETALLHHLANTLTPLVPHAQAWVLRERGRDRRMQVVAVSGLPGVDRESPRVRAVEARVRQGLRDEQWRGATAFTLEGSAGELDAQPFRQAAWMPLPDRDGVARAGALFLRETAFEAGALTLLNRLGEAYAHAWRALPADRSLAMGRRWQRWQAALLLTALGVAMAWPVRLTVLAPAEVVADAPRVITAPLAGVIRRIVPDPNSTVRAGDLLVQFEDLPLRHEMLVERQKLAVAQARTSRLGAAAFRDPQAAHELAIARAEHELAEVGARHAAEAFERTRISAPQAGLVLYADRRELEGRPVAVGQEILQLADPARVTLRIDLPVDAMIALREGGEVRWMFEGAPVGGRGATLERIGFLPVTRPGGELVQVLHARLDAGAVQRIGLRGTAQLQGERVPLAWQLLRRPIGAARQFLGW